MDRPDIFRAIADPTRREILALLSEGAMTVGDVADRFDMTRPAVAKHLKVLSDGGLISVEARGRERFNRLNAAPLRQVADWVSRFDAFWDDKLNKLKQEVEKEHG
ncbi:ArsR/SmtB family transcription factor [Maricaulis virginensis]|uniref:Transcriptional regulator n=1 Tax=Maricaulis virginensis TaxID=144022 RepID=A0A9W6IJE5_9PROT|nr:metalloregulator ArsR/SmtB family transcription factor [Maricaulis virginensis]GLK51422.1 transcriptional regulator [Maricaulis virginensis]